MRKQGNVVSILVKQMPLLRKEYGVKRLAIFGSVAQKTARSNSDVDILVEFSTPPGMRFMELADYLKKVLKKEIDILTPAGLKSIPHKNIASNIRKSLRYV